MVKGKRKKRKKDGRWKGNRRGKEKGGAYSQGLHYGPEPAHSQPKPLDGRIILRFCHIWFGISRNVFLKHGNTVLTPW